MNYELYIKGQKADLGDDVSILLTKERTKYTNPTVIKNPFSKTVTLSGTDANNRIFNDLWRLDASSNLFNPSKRVEFTLLSNGTLIDEGYIKLDRMVRKDELVEYEVTLYGQLGNILYGLSYKDDDKEMTLGDLYYDYTGFTINKDAVINAWQSLDNDTEDIWKSINFCVSYDGKPKANNFDSKGVWVNVSGRTAPVNWNERDYNNFPSSAISDEKTFRTVPFNLPQDKGYGYLELPTDATPLEMRDLRSYLLRPIFSIKGLFNAIGNYISENFGYTLDTSDLFFETDEYNKMWVTLSMLYEINEDIESNMEITLGTLFKNTSTPAAYLISYCKIFNIYMDLNIYEKKLKLLQMSRYFTEGRNDMESYIKITHLSDNVADNEDIIIPDYKEMKVAPLSFDKAAYSFDYADGKGEYATKYKETYNFPYGSAKVNTGYKFDSTTKKYIDNNVFVNATDFLEQGIYYRYSKLNGLYTYPQGVMDEADRASYKLFYDNQGEYETIDSEVIPLSLYPYRSYGYYLPENYINTNGTDVYYTDNYWNGTSKGLWQDGFPKVQICGSEKKGVDGRNILVMYRGKKRTGCGYMAAGVMAYSGQSEEAVENVKTTFIPLSGWVEYLVSDDNDSLKKITGKNCYYDTTQTPIYISRTEYLPSFTRMEYDKPRVTYDFYTYMVCYMVDKNFDIQTSNATVQYANPNFKFKTIIS